MTVAGHRSERIAEEIRNEISLMLAGDLKDPRLASPLDITEVRVSPDLRRVRVYVHPLGDESERAAALVGLQKAAGYIRHELVERLRLRRAPEISFFRDESQEYGQHIDQLLQQAKKEKT